MNALHRVIATLAAAGALCACVTTGPDSTLLPFWSTSPVTISYGVVESIDITNADGRGISTGAAPGKLAAGAKSTPDAYRIRVRMDNGGHKTVNESSAHGLVVGNRVRFEDERIFREAESRPR
jgi:hypothetical protein